MATYKGIKSTVSNANRYSCYAIVYNPTTSTVEAEQLTSLSDEPQYTDGRMVLVKRDHRYGKLTMANLKNLLNDCSWLF